MSRRRSQAQKENRDRVVNTRRQLSALQELEMSSLDASMALTNVSLAQEKKRNAQLPKNVAGEERLKQLQRWKERKALEKEKEKREKARKGVFKTGLYHPKDSVTVEPLHHLPAAHGRAKEIKASATLVQSTRITRSMKQQLEQKPLKLQDVNTAGKKSQPAVEKTSRFRGAAPKLAPCQNKTKEPVTRGSSTRSTNKPPVTAAPALKDKPKDKCAGVHTTKSKAPPHPTENKTSVQVESISKPDIEQRSCLISSVEKIAVDQSITDPTPMEEIPNCLPTAESFAPEGFLFQAPLGLSSFKFDPMTPRSADAFLTPSSSFTLPSAPIFDELKTEEKEPSLKSLRCSPPAPTTEPMVESKHDVPYFREEITNETHRLTGLCTQWESKVEDESIPEEMRDRMRTAVGQAWLLMKERFNQFSGLVDDCEFGRGEKITTCMDLQGFWDMVYFQVEDVNKKFDALKDAEAHGWVEELKPPPQQRKVVKKSAAASKPVGAKAAAKSRLAAAKAAMKARQQAESEKAVSAESTEQRSQEAVTEVKSSDTVMINDCFFKVNSPAKLQDSVRRSSRLSALSLQSPSSNYLTPRRIARQSLALAQTPVQINTNPQPVPTSQENLVNKTPAKAALSHATPQPENTVSVSFSFPTVKETSSHATEQTEDSVSGSGQAAPSITEVQNKPAEDFSGHLSNSPCKSHVESPAPMPSTSLSFSLSPCAAQLPSTFVRCTPQTVQSVLDTEDSLAATPDSCVNEGMAVVDFERYLQPSQRESLSPRQAFAMESPMAMDVDVESPKGQAENPLTQQETVSSTLPSMPTLVSSQSPQTAESALLLFTPDMKDRIRQSVCPSDLMVFTPPHL